MHWQKLLIRPKVVASYAASFNMECEEFYKIFAHDTSEVQFVYSSGMYIFHTALYGQYGGLLGLA
jgi:hypothetical protein